MTDARKPTRTPIADWCIWEDCDQEAIYCAGHAKEYAAPFVADLVAALREVIRDADRFDMEGSNHAVTVKAIEQARAALARASEGE